MSQRGIVPAAGRSQEQQEGRRHWIRWTDASPGWLRASRKRAAQRRPHRRRRRLLGAGALVLLAILLFTQANGTVGTWSADLLRNILGPQATAQIESWYLNVVDAGQRLEYRLSGQKPTAPWTPATTSPTPGSRHTLNGSAAPGPAPMPLPAMTPMIQPSLPGEGVWTTQGLPLAPSGKPPLVAKTFLRPDPARPYATVTLLQFDLRYVTLHMVAGTNQPGGPLHHYGSGVIPAADRQGNNLLAAFNGGFKYQDGQYGMMVNGTVYVPPQPGAATVALTKQGQVLMGAWGVTPELNSQNSDLAAWRQNASLLIDGGTLNPLTHDGAAWGGTVLNSVFTWRSGIGITAQGTLIYAAGNSLSALTLGETLKAAGAVTAMQTDINPFWVRAFLYERGTNGSLHITKLHPGMQGNGNEYLQGTSRDFFYITRDSAPQPGTTK